MKVIETESAVKIIYYLMAIDGIIKDEELNQFEAIGEELDRKSFDSYKDQLADECMLKIEEGKKESEFYYDVILEGVDEQLTHETTDPDKGLTPRLLMWNVLVVSLSDCDYDENERRLIQHIARRLNVDNSVILEMIQLIKAATDVGREKKWIMSSSMPYAKAKSMIDELEDRETILLEAAKNLIADDEVLDDPYVDTPDFFDKVAKQFGDAANPVAKAIEGTAKTIEGTANAAVNAVADTVSTGVSQAAFAASDFLKGIGGLFAKKKPGHQPVNEKHDEGEAN